MDMVYPPEKLPIGTRIRFLQRLSEGPTGDHPAFLFAPKGGLGEITGYNNWEGYMVKWDGWEHSFGASDKEFECVETK